MRSLASVRDEFDHLHRLPAVARLADAERGRRPDAMLIPACEYFALEGLADLVGTMRRVRAAEPRADIEGVLLTMFDERTNLGQQVATVRQSSRKVFRTVIPRTSAWRSAEPRHAGDSYDASPRRRRAYRARPREVLSDPQPRLHKKKPQSTRSIAEGHIFSAVFANHGFPRVLIWTNAPRSERPQRAHPRPAGTSARLRRWKPTSIASGERLPAARPRRRPRLELAQSDSRQRHRQPIIVRRIGDDSRSSGGAAGTPRRSPAMRVPVVVRDVPSGKGSRCSRWR